MRFLLFLFSFIVIFTAKVEAQIDPSSAMLLNSGSRATVRDSGVDSGRYTIRPRAEVTHREDRAVMIRKEPKPAPSTSADPDETVVVIPAPVQAAAPTPSATPAPSLAATSDFDDSPEEPALVKVQPDFRRYTMLQLSLAPGYLYNESKSTFTPRNYFLNSPAASVDAKVWVSSAFGVHTGFTGSLNGNVTDSLDNTKNATASDQWFSAGFQTRHFFGKGPSAPLLRLGLDYREFQFRVPSDSTLRNKLTTTGLFLLLDAEVPTSGFGSWMFGGEFGPALNHRETSAAKEFRTGDGVQTTSVGAYFGAHYRFDQTQSVFWKVSYGVERNLFSGSTTIPDSVSGLPQTNVSVTNTFSLFQLGYSWSN